MNPATTAEERNLAAANHVVSIFLPIVGPAVFFAIGKARSRFVAHHALAALVETLLLNLALLILAGISLSLTLARVAELIQTRGESFSWALVAEAAVKLLAMWLLVTVVGFVVTIKSIFQAIRAHRGEALRGWSARIAGRFLGKPVSAELPA